MKYLIRRDFVIDVGFKVDSSHVLAASHQANRVLADLPSSLYRCIDFKTISSVVGAIFCELLADKVGAIVNPIEKGHPDIVPRGAVDATEQALRNYSHGLEVKSTVGNVRKGANLRAGQNRLAQLVSLTWQAHHREVRELMGLVWDFTNVRES